MRYELLVQSKEPSVPFDEERARAIWAEQKVRDQADGTRLWALNAGEVELRPLRDAGAVVGTELSLPLRDGDALVRETVLAVTELAAKAGFRVVDPQLSREVSPADEALVAEHYLRTARYAAEYAGLPDVVMSTPEAAPGLSSNGKVMLAIGAFFVLVYLVMQRLA